MFIPDLECQIQIFFLSRLTLPMYTYVTYVLVQERDILINSFFLVSALNRWWNCVKVCNTVLWPLPNTYYIAFFLIVFFF
jgi:hypothetical protein